MDYKEKLEEAKKLYDSANYDQKYVLESLFPEIIENEEENIGKELIAFIKKRDRSGCDYDYNKWISWLEKQRDPNPYSGVSFKYNGHIWGMCARDNGVEILVDGEIKERVFLDNKPQNNERRII